MELKPCPFCGGKVEVRWNFREEVYEVRCAKCDGTYTHWFGCEDEEIEAWNRRVGEE